MRRLLVRMARRVEEGNQLELVQHPDWFHAQPMDMTTRVNRDDRFTHCTVTCVILIS
jgi:hypothetical protein